MCYMCGNTGWAVHGSAPTEDGSNVLECPCGIKPVVAKPKPDFCMFPKQPSLANSGEIFDLHEYVDTLERIRLEKLEAQAAEFIQKTGLRPEEITWVHFRGKEFLYGRRTTDS